MFLSALSPSSLQCSSAGVVQSLFSVNWAEPPIPYAEVILDDCLSISDQFEVFVKKKDGYRATAIELVICGSFAIERATDENSFLITSLTDAFSIRSKAFNWQHSFLWPLYTRRILFVIFPFLFFFFGAAFFSVVRGFAPKFPSLPIQTPATQ